MTTITTARQLDSENPWPGLESFEESAHDFFFGRDREAELLLNHVRDASVTVLYGRSGLGKTSLLRAGLFPAMRAENLLPIYVRLDLQQDSSALSRQLHETVHDSIRANVPDAVLPADHESLWEYLHRSDFELWSAQNYPLTPVIVIDQFEELFTLGERVPYLVREFMNDLGDLAENRIPAAVAARIDDDEAEAARFQLRSHNYKLLITLREDFLPHLEEWCWLIPALKRSRVRLLPLRADKALDAVHSPAAHLMSTDLAERVVRIVAGEELSRGRDREWSNSNRNGDDYGSSSVEPALLSLFCRELNEERKRRGQSEFDEHLVEDAKRDILSNYYVSCVRAMPGRVAEFIESELITEKGFRDSYAREDAVPSRLEEDELSQLIGSRLLRLEDYHGAQRIELTHDVLTGVVREHRDRRRADEEKRELAEAAERHAAELDRERRAGRRLRKLSVALALVCVVALVSAILAVKARDDADAAFRDATAQKLYGESQLMLAGLQPGHSDFVLGMQELLAAMAIPSKYRDDKYSLLTALNQERDLLKVIDGPAPVMGVAVSPDGTLIASTNSDDTVRLWDAATGESITEEPLRGHDNFASHVVFSPDGNRIATGGLDGTIRLWDVATGQPSMQPLDSRSGPVFDVAFSPHGDRIAAAGLSTVEVWDASTGQPAGEPLQAHEDIVNSVAFSPDGARLVTGGQDKKVRIWDAATRRQIGRTLDGHDESVTTVAFSPDGTQIVSASLDKTVRFWDAANGQPKREPLRHSNLVSSVAFSPDGARIATGGGDKAVRVWDVATGHEIGALTGHRSVINSVAFGPDGRRLVSGSDDKTVRVWDTGWLPMRGHVDRVGVVDFSADGRRIASGSKDNSVRVWDSATGRPVGPPTRIDGPDVDSVFPMREGRLISIGSDETVVRQWDARTSKPIGEPLQLPPNFLDLRPIAWDEDGTRIAATVDLGTVQLWDGDTMREVAQPLSHDNAVSAIGFTHDGEVIATGQTDGDSGVLRLWSTDTGAALGEPMEINGFATVIDFSPDGSVIAVGETSGSDYRVRLWDAEHFTALGEPLQVDHVVSSLKFGPDGKTLAAGGGDGTIRLWDAGARAQLGAPLNGHTAGVSSLEFSPDGTKLLSASEDHTLRVWPLPSAPTPQELCARITHNMSEEQWDRVVSPRIPYIDACPGLPRADDAG